MLRALPLQVFGHNISHNGHFLRRFWRFLPKSRTIPVKQRVRRNYLVFSRRPLCLMMIPICTGSIGVDSLVQLAPCSPISVARLRFVAWPEGGGIFMVAIPVAK